MSFEPGRPPSEANVVYTEPLVVPPQAAEVIDDWYGTSIMDTTGYLNVMKRTVLTAKMIKVFGGLFQQADYTQRLLFGQGLGFQAPSAVPAAFRMWRRSFDIPYHKKLIAAEAKDGTVRAELDKFAIQAGSDPSFVEGALRSAVGEELLPIPGLKQILTFLGGEAYGRFHREALYSAGEILHKHFMLTGLSFSEAAEKAAARANEYYSSPARWQSVMRNPSTRDWARIAAFAPGEVEGWARITWRAISSEDGARNLGGIIFGVFLTAEAINFMVTGHGLTKDQLLPFRFDIDDRSELPFLDFNVNFLRPELPWTGPFGRKLYLDLLGQADTPMRLALAPLFGVKTRLGQLPGFATRVVAPLINEQDVTTFGGRTVDFSKPLDIVRLVGEQIAPIPLTPFSGGEAERIGFLGGAVQGAGLNISGESLGARGTLARKFDELYPQLAPFDADAHMPLAADTPELRPLFDELRRLGIQFGSEASIAAEARDELLVKEEEDLVPMSQGVLEGNPLAGPKWREQRSRFLTFAAGSAATAFGEIDFREVEGEPGKALERFYAIDPADFIDPETFELDHAGFDQARERELSQLPQEIQDAIKRKMRFTDPDNIAVEEIRQKAAPLLDLLYEDDRYGMFLNISQEGEDEYRAFMALVEQQRDIIEERTGNRPGVEQMIRAAAQVEDKSAGFMAFAIAARPGSSSRKRLLNPARDVFLLKNMEALRPLYPKLYDS
ncbi:MAG: hypothetical protein IIC89_08780, partial [Chloroflexi bacterium]|nr:hypothetical protein [Chloroflexota bacterium]